MSTIVNLFKNTNQFTQKFYRYKIAGIQTKLKYVYDWH